MAASAAALAREADAAANEAARDARAEVYERAGADEPKTKKPTRKDKRMAKASKSADGWQKFVVNVWVTNFNSVEFGIYKHSRNRAKSRQFTKDMDVFAEVI